MAPHELGRLVQSAMVQPATDQMSRLSLHSCRSVSSRRTHRSTADSLTPAVLSQQSSDQWTNELPGSGGGRASDGRPRSGLRRVTSEEAVSLLSQPVRRLVVRSPLLPVVALRVVAQYGAA